MPSRLLAALVIAAGFVAPAAGTEKKPALRNFPFWTAPKTPHARAFVPGLQAALQLTPDQIAKIEAACHDTIDTPEARTKQGAGAANDKLHALVADILTPEQKKLIEKMNDSFARVSADQIEDFQPKFGAAKGNAEETAAVREAYQKAVAEQFENRLDQILTAEQREAVKKAAEEEKKRAAENAGKPK